MRVVQTLVATIAVGVLVKQSGNNTKSRCEFDWHRLTCRNVREGGVGQITCACSWDEAEQKWKERLFINAATTTTTMTTKRKRRHHQSNYMQKF